MPPKQPAARFLPVKPPGHSLPAGRPLENPGGMSVAGDWIKMRLDLDDDPAVISAAAALSIPEEHVVGCLWKLWRWASTQTTDGNAAGVTGSWLDRYVGVADFAETLVKVGWLTLDSGGLHIPKFERHMSESAKTRALTGIRVAKHRCNASSVTKTLPEKRREESSPGPYGPRTTTRAREPFRGSLGAGATEAPATTATGEGAKRGEPLPSLAEGLAAILGKQAKNGHSA